MIPSKRRRLQQLAYGILGVGGVVLGGLGLLFGSGPDPEQTHLVREVSAMTVFAGLMSAWCIPNYDRRRWVHESLTLLAVLFAAIHWLDVVEGRRPLTSGLVNTVPLAMLLLMRGGLRGGRASAGFPEQDHTA